LYDCRHSSPGPTAPSKEKPSGLPEIIPAAKNGFAFGESLA